MIMFFSLSADACGLRFHPDSRRTDSESDASQLLWSEKW